MPLISTVTSRAASAVAAAALAVAAIALVPAPAHADDSQVCVTASAPTAASRPWYDFALAANPVWKAKTRFTALVAEAEAATAKLGPSSTEAEIQQVDDSFSAKFGAWRYLMELDIDRLSELDLSELDASLRLVDPGAVDAAHATIVDAYVALVMPGLDELKREDGALATYLDTFFERLSGSYPLTGPVMMPSATLATAALGAVAAATDAWHDIGNAHVVRSGTPTATCVATATLQVPSATTVFGTATTVTITATRGGVAARGDYAVLLDGQQIGSARRQSTYVATIPGTLDAGTHLLTVAFAPVDGSPISTRSSTVTVTKARTTTSLKVSKAKVKHGKRVRATVTVAVPGTALTANGTATVKVGKRTIKAKITNGRGSVSLGKPKAGRYSLKATYTGAPSLAASTSSKVKLSVRR